MATNVLERTEAEATTARLQSSLAEVCGHLNVLHESMVTIVVEALTTRAWEGEGIASPAVWLAWQTGLSPERARQVITMARRKAQLPETFHRFQQGLLSVDQVAVIARRVPAHNDLEAAQLAESAGVAQLRIAFSRHFIPPAPAPDPEPQPESLPDSAADKAQPDAPVDQEPAHWFAAGWDDDGTVHMHGNADCVEGALILNALREAKDALFRAGNLRATWLDALVDVCARSLRTLTSQSRRDLYRTYIHLDTEGAWMHKGGPVPPALLATFMCDGQVRPVWTTGGLPVNVGRSQHIVSLHTRLLVENRDRMCRRPTCASTYGLEVHHVVPWAPPTNGLSDTSNLVCLCRRDHAAHHRGEFTITGNADQIDGLVFRDRQGRIIEGSGRPTPPGDQPPPGPEQPYQHPSGERFHSKWFSLSSQPATFASRPSSGTPPA